MTDNPIQTIPPAPNPANQPKPRFKAVLSYLPVIIALLLLGAAWYAKQYFAYNRGGPRITSLQQQRSIFWNVDRRYYISEIPKGQEDDQRWKTFMLWQEKAIHFDPEAMFRVGTSYYLGVPVKQNNNAAAYWFKIAADEFGLPQAMYNYASIMADKGDRETYSKYVITAAELGLPEAQNEVARNLITTGDGGNKELFQIGLNYAKKSAESGSYSGILVYSNYLNQIKDKTAAVWLHRLDGKGDLELLGGGVNPLEVSTMRLNILHRQFDNDPLAYQQYMKEQGITVNVIVPKTGVGMPMPVPTQRK